MNSEQAYPVKITPTSFFEKNKRQQFFVETLSNSYDERDFLEKIQSRHRLSSTLLHRLVETNILQAWFNAEVVKTAREIDVSAALGRIAAKWKDGHLFAKRIEACCVGKGVYIDSDLVLHAGLAELSQLFGEVSYSPLGYVESLYQFYKHISDPEKTDPSALRALLCHALLVVHKLELAKTIQTECNILVSTCLDYLITSDKPLLLTLFKAPTIVVRFVLSALSNEIEDGHVSLLATINPLYQGIPLASCAVALGQFEMAKKLFLLDPVYRDQRLPINSDISNSIALGVELRRKQHSFGEHQDLKFMIAAYVMCADSYEEILREQSQKHGYDETDFFTEEQKKMFDCGHVSFEHILRKIKKVAM